MKFATIAWLAATIGLSPAAALAEGQHAGGHSDMAIGEPGKPSKVSRTIAVTMRETDDGRLFEPAEIKVKRGETVRL